jgi:DNA modification methylase
VWAVNFGIIKRDDEVLTYWDAYLDHAKSLGLKLLSWNVWDKGWAGSVGSASAMFGIQHEFIFVLGKQSFPLNRTEPNKRTSSVPAPTRDRQADGSTSFRLHGPIQRFRQLGTVIKQAPQMARNLGYDFPAAFPVELAERYIKACTHQGSIVYDPFGGSGTTLMACQKTGRACLTMEIVPSYCDLIVQRWQQETRKKATRQEAA